MHVVKPYERKQLLERIDRDGSTVGASIPESISVQGERVRLRDFVFELRRRDAESPSSDRRTHHAVRALRRERLDRRRRLETEPIDRETGQRLVESIIGIDRALEAIQGSEEGSITARIEESEAADRERWLAFLRQVMGKDQRTGRYR